MQKLSVPTPLHVWQCNWCGYIWEAPMLPKYDSPKYQPCPNCNMRGYVYSLYMEDTMTSKHDRIKNILNEYDTIEDAVTTYIKQKVEPNITGVSHIAAYDNREALLVTYTYSMRGYDDYTDDCTIFTAYLDWKGLEWEGA